MPYVMLAIGLLLALYGLYRFILRADVQQIKALFLTIGCIIFAIGLFFLIITGRLAHAVGLLAITFPILYPIVRRIMRGKPHEDTSGQAAPNTRMSREEALEILGLEEGANNAQIQAAYKRLIKKVHPDQEGSEWIAAKLNEARDFLLKQ